MTADENAAIMRRAYEAFNSADINTLIERFDESAVWHLPGRSRFADDEDRVIGMQRSTGDRDGKHLDVDNCIVIQLKDGRVTDGREHFHDLYAWDEFWA